MSDNPFLALPVQRDAEGFLLDLTQWTEEIAKTLAQSMQSNPLTLEQLAILKFARAFYAKEGLLPPTRLFVSQLRNEFQLSKASSQTLYSLFPGKPMLWISLLAGLPKPIRCL